MALKIHEGPSATEMINRCFEIQISEFALVSPESPMTILGVLKSSGEEHTEL